jgi:hypothetical protein
MTYEGIQQRVPLSGSMARLAWGGLTAACAMMLKQLSLSYAQTALRTQM